MSKTKFTKVAVSERLPSKDNKYFVIDINGELNKVPFRDAEFHSWQPIFFWLEESPDREDEMIEMLEGCKKSLDFVYENWKYPMYFDEDGKEEPEAIEHVLYRRQELDKLLQSLTLKQEK